MVSIDAESPVRVHGQQMVTKDWSLSIVNSLADATEEELVATGELNLGAYVKAIHDFRQS